MNLYVYNVNLWQIFYEYFPSSKSIEQKELSKAFCPVLNGAGSVQRGDGEHRQRAGHKHFLHAERRAAGGDGRYKGADAGRIGLPRQEFPHSESEAESRVQGDALRQRAIIRLTNH